MAQPHVLLPPLGGACLHQPNGTKAAELPVEQPTVFELVVNLQTAKAMGMAVPKALLRKADVVVQ